MQQDLAFGRPDSFAQANLKGSLGHAHQHDVHHHDAANQERNQRNRHHHRRDRSGKLIDLIVQRLDVHQPEVVLFISFQPMLVAHRHAGVFDHRLEVFAIGGFAVNLQAIATENR